MHPTGLLMPRDLFCHLRIVFLQQLAGRGVYRTNDVHCSGEVENSIDYQRRADETHVLWQIDKPIHPESMNRICVDVLDGAEAGLGMIAAIREPFAVTLGVSNRDIVDLKRSFSAAAQAKARGSRQ